MSPLTALMPTHAAIAEHLATAPGDRPCASVEVRDQSPVARAASAPISFCKYVILSQDDREYPLVFSQDIQHSSMVPLGYKAVGAGFVLICGTQVRVIEGHGSSTLHLDPRPQDQGILRTFLSRPIEPALVNPVNHVNTVSPSAPTHFSCFRCRDAATPLYCLNCASDLLAAEAKHQCSSVPVRVSP
jgi:hypothetical protein